MNTKTFLSVIVLGVTDPESMGGVFLSITALKELAFNPVVTWGVYSVTLVNNLSPIWLAALFYMCLFLMEKNVEVENG